MATPGTIPANPKLPKAGFWWALGIFIVTAIVGVVMIIISIGTIANAIGDFRRIDVPGTSALQLDTGEYWVFAGTPGSSSASALLVDVVVTAPDGSTVRLSSDFNTYNADSNGTNYTSLGKFKVDRAGTYEFETDGPSSATLRVGKLPIGKFVGLLVGGIAIGALGFLIALVLLIVTFVRRSSAKKRLAAAYPGAYGTPPPYVPPTQGAVAPPVMPPPSPAPPTMPPPQATPPSTPPPPPAAPSTPPPPPAAPPSAPGSSGSVPPPPPGGGAPTPPPSGPVTPPPPPGEPPVGS